MATEIVHTIRASGGDYTTLSAWEAAQQRDLVAADEIAVAECYNDWPSGLVDYANITGFTTDATRNIIVRAADGHQHTGEKGTGFVLKTPTNSDGIRVNVHYALIEGLEVTLDYTSGARSCIICALNSSAPQIKNCILTTDVNTTGSNLNGISIGYVNIQSAKYINNLIDFSIASLLPTYGITVAHRYSSIGDNSIFANNTIIGCTSGFYSYTFGSANSYNKIVKNNVFYNCTTDFAAGVLDIGTWDVDYNATSLASGSSNLIGSNNVYGIVSSDFTDYAGYDFSIPSTSQLRDAGADLSTEFTTDILGNPRGV